MRSRARATVPAGAGGATDWNSGDFGELSGRREGVFGLGFGLDFDVGFRAVRATGAAGFGAGTEGLVDDGLDGAGATAAFSAAAEAAVDLLGAARKVRRRSHGIADIMVAQDVAGT